MRLLANHRWTAPCLSLVPKLILRFTWPLADVQNKENFLWLSRFRARPKGRLMKMFPTGGQADEV
jgi:hypothetical protein